MTRTWIAYRRELALALGFLASACEGLNAQQITPKSFAELTQRVQALEAHQGEQECGQELRHMLADARAECSANGASSTEAATEGSAANSLTAPIASSGDTNSCSLEQLKGAMKIAERALNPGPAFFRKGRSLRTNPLVRMLDRFRCEVLYPDGESEEIPAARQDRLNDMVQLPALPQTRYIILASTTRGETEARHRADLMRHELERLGVAVERIDPSWLYPFVLTPQQIHRPGLLPQPPETGDLFRAVWACQTSC